MEFSLLFSQEPRSSRLIIGHQLSWADELAKFLPSPPPQLAILTDANLALTIAPSFQEHLQKAGIASQFFSFPAGEQAKTRATKEQLENDLLQAGFGRDTLIIGLGGGITTDLAGFVAATFCRGVPFVAIPTTLMGMVDASIGGKTAVNTPFAKNMIGAFHPPVCVIIDTAFLATLSVDRYQEGLAEIVKYALIASPNFFTTLISKDTSWHQRDVAFLHTLIHQACAIKASIIEQDPYEKGLRRILNFGHTIGHALETASSHHISHGQAVAIGMMMESRISHHLGLLPLEDLHKIEYLFSLYNLPKELFFSFDPDLFITTLKLDKKGADGQVRIVTLDRIGSASSHNGHYCRAVDLTLLQSIFESCSV